MSFWGRLIAVFYDPERHNLDDLEELAQRTRETFGEQPEYIKGTKKLMILTTKNIDVTKEKK